MTPPNAKLHEGVWLPATEQHFVEMMSPKAKRFTRLEDGRACYQRHKLLAALEFVSWRRVFVDIGGHVGLWAYQAEEMFDQVISFEPVARFADIYPHNMRTDRWTLHRVALGEAEGTASFEIRDTDTGCTHITGQGDVPIRTLDSFDLDVADLIKIDVEGFELPVVKGAVETLERCRPVVVIEQKGNDVTNFGGKRDEAVQFLRGRGMVPLRPPIAGDWIMGWPA